MPEVLFLCFFLLVLGIISFAAYHAHKRAKARTAAIGMLASRLGWRFYGEQRHHGFDDELPRFDCFRRGRSRYAHNRLAGTIRSFDADLPAEAGDYHYQIRSGSGKNRSTRTYRFSYLLVTLPFGRALPSLCVRSENLFDKLAGAVGFEDIDFESAEFSRRHHVSSNDRRFTYALIDPRMIEFLLGSCPSSFELESGRLLAVSKASAGDSRWTPEQIADAIGWAEGFFERWPAHLVSDLKIR